MANLKSSVGGLLSNRVSDEETSLSLSLYKKGYSLVNVRFYFDELIHQVLLRFIA